MSGNHIGYIETGLFDDDGPGIGNVVVARRRGGSWDLGVFLVDRFCLGVKNAFLLSQRDDAELDEILGRIFENGREKKDVARCRKFIEGAVDYARGFGFAPHGDYKKASRVFGGVKAADCAETFRYGMDGKPHYVQGPYEDERTVERILGRLRARCGEDGFHYAVRLGDEASEDEAYDDDDSEDSDDDQPAKPAIKLYCECAGGGGRREAFEEMVEVLVDGGMPFEPELVFEPDEHELADALEPFAFDMAEVVERAYQGETGDEVKREALRGMAMRLLANSLVIAAFNKKERRELLKSPDADENERAIVRAILEDRDFFARLRSFTRFFEGSRCLVQVLLWEPPGDEEEGEDRLHVVYMLMPD